MRISRMISNVFISRILLALLTIQSVSGGRGVFLTKLKHTPFGIGFQSAIQDNSILSSRAATTTRIRNCNEISNKNDYSRHAAVSSKDDAAVLGNTVLPHRRVSRRQYLNSADGLDDLDYDNVLSCSTTSKSLYMSIPEDDENEVILEVGSVGSMKASAVPAIKHSKSRQVVEASDTRGGSNAAAAASAAMLAARPLLFWENMISGAISRSVAQTIMHPANTMKTILQSSRGVDRPTLSTLMRPSMFKMLTRGAGANFVLSVPHGAVNFAVLEFVRGRMNKIIETVPYLSDRLDSIGPLLDFSSSAVSTICCSIVSTPQMMITDNIMAGNYPSLPGAIKGIYLEKGLLGFYAGWWPGLVGKIPSYALTWTFFQQLKRVRDKMSDRPAKNFENTIMGCIASATTVSIMIPMDTIKTRLVTQMSSSVNAGVPYKGIIDCAMRITREEGIRTFYRGLAPRLISVVPMIGIQFGVYEAMKKVMLSRTKVEVLPPKKMIKTVEEDLYGPVESLEEVAMEVAADNANPFPAPHFLKKLTEQQEKPSGRSRVAAKKAL